MFTLLKQTSYGHHDVSLCQDGQDYVVVYGQLQIRYSQYEYAKKEYQECRNHQEECANL